ncbi:MAG: ribosome recycling factor [Elusimicrobia bacterium RIFOXYA2_FULL_39_19]|nr:MAG: ribosome recycling factor [Elusimicrobia bacterium RIFOXYA2_FULL_39_19]
MTDAIINQAEDLMKKTIERFRTDLSALRTGRASSTLIENIKVNCYNSVMPINQVAGISVPDARTIELRPWDTNVIPFIEKAIHLSQIGINPANDGKVIRLILPPLTEERRKDLIKHLNKIAEDFRISVRNDRHKAIETIKKTEKEKKISEDQRFKAEEKLQKITETYIKKIEEALLIKEKEILA